MLDGEQFRICSEGRHARGPRDVVRRGGKDQCAVLVFTYHRSECSDIGYVCLVLVIFASIRNEDAMKRAWYSVNAPLISEITSARTCTKK